MTRFLILLLLAFQATAQVKLDYYLPTDVRYNPAIPTPESFFGFQVGEWHLHPDQLHAYMKALDDASDRITMTPMGRSYEQRQIWLMTITAPENHANIDALRQQHLALSDPATPARAEIDKMPVVVWLGYSVHGNEPSGSNASPLVAYYLAAAQGDEIEKLLRETVILLNPSINPDGLNRFATWANMHRGKQPVADPNSREHNEAWPGGRTNHYWFDLNRDWMPLQHPESRARLEQYYRWMPNVLTDHHEMGTNATFFFQPGVPSRENPLTPKRVADLTAAIAKYHARALDAIGSLYYTKEGYDDFYVGKGSSYPDLTGGIGILFEQASSRGHVQESIHGDVTFPFTIRNQFTTSLSTLRAAQEMRRDLLNHRREFIASAIREAERAPVKAYLFGSSADPARNSHLLDILLRHNIDVYDIARQFRVDGTTFEPGSAYLVPTNQKQFRLVTSLFERRTQFEDSLFYDISTWTLPLAFGLPSSELKSLSRDLLGTRVEEPRFPSGTFAKNAGAYAYAFEWSGYYAPRALYRLLKAGIKATVANRHFEAVTARGVRAFDYGTIVIPAGLQPEKSDTLLKLLEMATQEDGIDIYALSTGMSASGVDLGSPSFSPLELPKPAILVGSGVSFLQAGEAWHLLDERFGMDVSVIEGDMVHRADLSRYNVLVMTRGTHSGIGNDGVEAIKRWVESGGTLIAMESAAEWAVEKKLASATYRRDSVTRKDSVVMRRPYGDEDKFRGALNFAGAIFATAHDPTHPLLFGYGSPPPSVFKANTIFMDPSESPYATPLLFTEKPLLSGYMHRDYEKRIKGAAIINVSALGSGRVILCSENPNFRAFWFGTNKMFLNGVFLGSTIRASSAR
jgi:hypothetical protein